MIRRHALFSILPSDILSSHSDKNILRFHNGLVEDHLCPTNISALPSLKRPCVCFFTLFLCVFLTLTYPPATSSEHSATDRSDTGLGRIPHLIPSQWLADLDTIVVAMKQKHGNLYHAMSEQHFREAVRSLRARVPRMNDYQITAGFTRLIGMVQCGHNNLDLLFGTGSPYRTQRSISSPARGPDGRL